MKKALQNQKISNILLCSSDVLHPKKAKIED